MAALKQKNANCADNRKINNIIDIFRGKCNNIEKPCPNILTTIIDPFISHKYSRSSFCSSTNKILAAIGNAVHNELYWIVSDCV